MTRLAFIVLFGLAAFGAPAVDRALLKGIEERYNRTKTLKVTFVETYGTQTRVRRTEKGTLLLRKPGKMRWDYTEPAGKLFLSDGKEFFYYNPLTRQAEKMKMKEAEDMRAPLAFLLGKLDFDKDFKNFQMRQENGSTWITAEPKSDKLPYQKVEFLVDPGFTITRLNVTGLDNSLLTFAFSGETVNPPLDDKLFRFVLPEGATYVQTDSGK